MQLLIDRVRTAASGYAPFFDIHPVREGELEQLQQFDEDIANQVPAINDHINAINAAIHSGAGFDEALDGLLSALDELHKQFDRRTQIIHGVADIPPAHGDAPFIDRTRCP